MSVLAIAPPASVVAPSALSARVRGAAFGLGWAGATQLVGTVLKLGSTLILTRLLAPEAYALLGTALVVLTTLEWLSDVGVTPALVRNPRGGDPEWLITGWWISAGRGVGMAVCAALVAVPLAHFYRQPELVGVLAALAGRPFLLSLRSPGLPLLRRHLEYRGLFIDEVLQTAVGAITSITIAWCVPGAGVEALVGGTLAAALTGVIVSYMLVPMLPRFRWDADIARHLAGFGGQVFVNTLIMAVWLNLDRLVGPRFLALEPLGWYMIAWTLASTVEALTTRGTDVYFSLLARRAEHDRWEWHQAVSRRVVAWSGLVLAFGVASAPLAVRIVYDPRYAPVGLLFAGLLARLIFRVSGQLDFQLLLANGNVRPATLSYVAGAVAQAVLVVPLVLYAGVDGLLLSVVLSTILVSVAQSLLSPSLGRDSLMRLAVAAGWAGVGLAGALAADCWLRG